MRRALRLRAALLAGRSAARRSSPHAQLLAALPRQSSSGLAAFTRRTFSFSSTFPTPAESAALAHADDEHDANRSHLVCGSCSSPLSQTSDLIFFKWYVVVGS